MASNDVSEHGRGNVFTVSRRFGGSVEMSASDYFEKIEEDKMCPECEKHKKHVRLVEAEGKVMECPVCHYTHLARR
jgi:ribosomal protein L37AE/L43A